MLAQMVQRGGFGGGGAWGIGEIIITIIIVAAAIGILYVCLRKFGVRIPQFAVSIFWICVCAFVAIIAIRFLLSL